VTAAIDPTTGQILWATTKHSIRGGTTISGKDGRLYVGGYNGIDGDKKRCGVWCLDAADGSLIWESDPLEGSIHVVSIGETFVFAHVQYGKGYVLDRRTGRIRSTLRDRYYCTRFTLSEPYLVGPNMDLIDVSRGNELVSSGPPVDVIECVGAIVSNGRVFYTAHGSGIQCSAVPAER
jgi:outer membrane protein assembly factor BamB